MEALSNSREKGEKEEVGEDEILKRRISSHPSYGLLVDAHLGCLKAGLVGEPNNYHTRGKEQQGNNPSFNMVGHSELDHFMEAYCLLLQKLNEAMEEPQENLMAFINNMHSQLKELASTRPVLVDPATHYGE